MELIIKKPDDAIIVNKKDGTHVAYYLFDEYEVHLNSLPPQTEQVWHFHQAIEEVILIIEGEIEIHYLDNDKRMRQRVQPNDLILVKDSIHTLINRSTKECKFVVFRLVLDGKNKRDLIKNDKKVVNML